MDLSDDINQCAYLVKQGDYDRYRAVMTLDPNLRSNLFVLLAANIEIITLVFLLITLKIFLVCVAE